MVVRLLGLSFAGAAGCMAAVETSLLSEFTVRRWSVEDGMPEASVTSIEQRTDGYLWCATPHYLLRFDGVRFVEMAGEQSPATVRGVVTDVPPGVEAREVTATMLGGDDSVWVGTARGLYRCREGRWSELTARDGMFPWDVRCMTMDWEGNVWVGTSGGLVRLRNRVVTMFRAGSTVGSESITAMLAESPTNFWVGVAGGGLLTGPPEALRPVRVGQLPEDATVSALCRGRDGTLWIGTQGDYLWRWRPDGGVSAVREAADSGMSAQGISALLEDRSGQLWVGTWQGLMRLNGGGELVPVAMRIAGAARMQPLMDTVQVLSEGPDRWVWVGYQRSGLIRARWSGKAEQFQEDVGVLAGSLFALHWDSAGTLWIGTSRGLGRWRGGECQQFTTDNGLADKMVLQVMEDDTGDLWLGTRKGLMRVQTSEFDAIVAGSKKVVAARHMGAEAGMADEECTGRLGARAVRTADGRLWFPTMEGIAMVDPRQISARPVAPLVYVEEIRLGGELVALTAPVRLPLGKRDLGFRFTAPALRAPERAHFKFQLEGYDIGWSKTTAERTVSYSSLGPGKYQFRVMGRDRDSDWSEPTKPVVVIVPPFLWETVGFWVLIGAAAAAGVGMSMRVYYGRQADRKLEEMERRHAMERERERIARDIHDDVGAGLTEVAMLSELAQEELGRPTEIREQLSAIFRRATELTRSLDEIVWAINPANDTLEGLLSYVGEFAQGFLAASGTACRLDFPADPPTVGISATVRHHLCLAIKEVLHNIVKHADAGEVHVLVTVEGRQLTIEITDDGRGFLPGAVPGAELGRDGLKNLRARLAAIGGKFHQECRSGRGTRTVLSVELPTAAVPAIEAR